MSRLPTFLSLLTCPYLLMCSPATACRTLPPHTPGTVCAAHVTVLLHITFCVDISLLHLVIDLFKARSNSISIFTYFCPFSYPVK